MSNTFEDGNAKDRDVDALLQVAFSYDNAGMPEMAENKYLSACEILLEEARTLQAADASADSASGEAYRPPNAAAAANRLELLRAKADVVMERVAWHQQQAAAPAKLPPQLSGNDAQEAAVTPFGCGAFFLRLAVTADHPRTRTKSLAAYEISVAAFLQVLRTRAEGGSHQGPDTSGPSPGEDDVPPPPLPPPQFMLSDADRALVARKVQAVLDHLERLHASGLEGTVGATAVGGGSARPSNAGGRRGTSGTQATALTRPVATTQAGMAVQSAITASAMPAQPPSASSWPTLCVDSSTPSGGGALPAYAAPLPPSAPPAGSRSGTPVSFSSPSRSPAMPPPGTSGQHARPLATSIHPATAQPPKYTERELQVLRQTSRIGGKVYLPWVEGDGQVLEGAPRQQQPVPDPVSGGPSQPPLFTDPDGLLPLAQKQRRYFAAWRRPGDVMKLAVQHVPGLGGGAGPCLIQHVSAFAVTQTVVSDCSFVSSLAVTAAYERRFNKRLITSRLFPQDARGLPVYNPHGQYVAKLFFNGIWRKVVVDDLLPTSASGDLLCSFSSNRREFWVSLLEKAYLKVAGGYDFPGSTSEVDLYALTGWIPECVAIKDNARPFLPDKIWARMRDGHYMGQCLMTVSTGPLSDQEEAALGLVTTHAYALLDVREVVLSQGGARTTLRMLQLKNPWCEVRWKGAYSASDTVRWTPALRQALAYDAAAVALEDNGVFWIDWESFLRWFANIHFNWNPFLFRPPATIHSYWPSSGVPQSDMYSLGECPQFAVTVYNHPASGGAVPPPPKPVSLWILLSKHITNRAQANEDFLALHVFVPASPGDSGKRVYYPDAPLVKGVYMNAEHRLLRVDVPSSGPHGSPFVVVVSQVRRPKEGGVAFTLRCHCEVGVVVAEIPMGHPHECAPITGGWARGSRGVATFYLDVPRTTELVAQLQVPKEYGANLKVVDASLSRALFTSNVFRPGFFYLRLMVDVAVDVVADERGITEARDSSLSIKPRRLLLIVSNYESAEAGNFILRIGSTTCPVSVAPAPLTPEMLLWAHK